MSEEEMEEKDIVKIVLDELVKRGLLKKNINTFESTKDLLKNLNRIENSTKYIDRQIGDLDCMANTLGAPKVPKATKFDKEIDNSVSTIEQIEQRINNLTQSKIKINVFIKYIKNIIKTILSQEEQKLIESFFFEKKDVTELCVEYDCEQSTIYRRVNKAISSIKIEIFTEKYIEELYN